MFTELSILWLPLFMVVAYLLGTVRSALLVSRWYGLQDPRQHGSGNPGTTNILRLGGKQAAAVTLVGDIAKGVIPILFGYWLSLPQIWLGWIGFSVIVGHIFPWRDLHGGGKGVATAIGVLLALAWPLALLLIIFWLVVAVVFRYSSLAALIACIFAPVIYSWWQPQLGLSVLGISLLIVLRHIPNIRRLLAGNEPKINLKSKTNQSSTGHQN